MRPKTAGERMESQMIDKAKKDLERTTDPIEKLRCLCLSRGNAGIVGIGRMFRRIDDNRSGSLDIEEFKKGVHDSGLKLPDDQLQAMFQQFDQDGSGKVSIDEFLISLRVM
ncbi:calcyphosin-like protein isoform X2 [Eurytemora carolleeae]|uniref:calcyphosin-like protein isoform X2 n=1 Tax=Eurytemora carolleeae TaxID=1294199 RepID=UPI000C75CD71|nr:calcyphosin-like protein isoform X2 [Eurytemora carolleeae]|eukprot:XP_023325602.1 calcyphosin-like protein isoform X2 [Eurytemora affinis]